MTAALLTRMEPPAPMRLRGVAVAYEMPSDVGGVTEVVAAGAFRNLDSPDITLVDGHDESRLLARTGAGTLRLMDSPARLEYAAELPDTELGRAAWTLTERGDYGGASVGMVVREEKLETLEGGRLHRRVLAAELIHISPVGKPAYNQTQVTTASTEGREGKIRWL